MSTPPELPSRSSSTSPSTSRNFDVGMLELIFGSMFSGKTTYLLNQLTTCADVGLNCLYINHSSDQREVEKFDTNVTTHHSLFNGISEKISTKKTSSLSDIDVEAYDVIGIDEGQFFEDIVPTVRKWVMKYNKHVFISSLDGDSNIKPFGHVHELICLCHPGSLRKLEAKCMNCLKTGLVDRHLSFVPAGYSFKKSGSKETQTDVGGVDKYMAVCLKCHINCEGNIN